MREEDATEYTLALAIYYSVSVLYILHVKKEREEDATEYALGSGNIIYSVSVLYIYIT